MKKLSATLSFLTLCLISCNQIEPVPIDEISLFSSSDTTLAKSYEWARKTALGYAHDDSDPVGYWYEAALPNREAFCMRDVAHQTIGAHILGLQPHNKNMMMRFAENITEAKDWCSYWEINRYNKPAPADYENDSTFWYNLPANFDVTQACLKLYEWTADKDYIKSPTMQNFYTKSLNEYVERWMLQPENTFLRPRNMNMAQNFDINKSFHRCRGLASYAENFPGITMSLDLLSSMYAANKAYARISEINNDSAKATDYQKRTEEYKQIIEQKWWDSENSRYNTFWTVDKVFRRGEGVPFVLWFEVSNDITHRRAAINDILSIGWNIENLSAFPALLYRNGYNEDAYKFATELPQMNRSEYPEVSFGVVEGIISGAMGIYPKMSQKKISTCSHLPAESWAEVKNMPLADGYITLKHNNASSSTITNNTSLKLTWEVGFIGDYATIEVDGKHYPTEKSQDTFGNTISSCKVSLKSGKTLSANAKR